jgi:ribosome recycling factor
MTSGKERRFPTVSQVLADSSNRMNKAVQALRRELATMRTGRASSSLVENVPMDYYGVPTPLNQLASITVPDARLIVIQPWDKKALGAIEKGLMKSELGLNPSNDGNVIRVPIPPLSQERRQELVKVLRKKIEECKVSIRNVRRDALEQLREMQKNRAISQDEERRAKEQLQKQTDVQIAQADQVAAAKETEIMQV